MKLTLAIIRDLCERFVPVASRHPSSLDCAGWWPAHEIGHMLTVDPRDVGEPMFGLLPEDEDEDEEGFSLERADYLRCSEMAAMSVSRRLLTAAGHRDLADDEDSETDSYTLTYEGAPLVIEILARRRCIRLPRTRRGLTDKLRRVARAAARLRGDKPIARRPRRR